jgi:hypothetical protein
VRSEERGLSHLPSIILGWQALNFHDD